MNEPIQINLLTKIKLIASAILLLVFALGFNAALGLNSLKKLYEDTVLSPYRGIGKALQQRLEESGSLVSDGIEIRRLLEETKERMIKEMAPTEAVSVSVALSDGVIRYSTEKNLNGKAVPENAIKLVAPPKPGTKMRKSDYLRDENKYLLFFPLRDKAKEVKGMVMIDCGETQISSLNEMMFHRTIRRLGIIILAGSFLLVISALAILKPDTLEQFPRKKLSVAIFSVILLSQMIFSGLNIYDFKEGVRGQESEIRSRKSGVGNQEEGVRMQDSKDNGEGINASISDEAVSARFNEMILDSLTVLVISVFFFVEMLILLFHFMEKQIAVTTLPAAVRYSVIRPATFLFFFSFALCISFLPLHIEKLYKPILGLSKDMVMGLPISVRTFLVGISFLITGAWLDRRGWHEPFFIGLFLSSAGFIYCWIAPDALQFIIACGVVGFGYGLYLMASQGFIIAYTDEKSKAQGFAQLFSGMYAGILCGGAAGAMLAERIGYNGVFLISAIILLSVIIYTLLFMREAIRKPDNPPDTSSQKGINIRQIFLFFFDRNIISVFLFSSLFVNMGMTGFIEYFNPVYLNRIGASQSNIGRTFMLYSFCIVYIGPLISKHIDVSGNKKQYIFINGLVGSAGCIAFYLLDGILASLIAVLMLGISQSFAFASQNAYMLKFRITQELGGGKAIAVFRSASRIGQVAGPMVFGWLILSMGTNNGIAFFGIAYLTASFLFLFLAQRENR